MSDRPLLIIVLGAATGAVVAVIVLNLLNIEAGGAVGGGVGGGVAGALTGWMASQKKKKRS